MNEIKQQYNIPDTLHGGCEDTVDLNETTYSKLYINFLLRILNFSNHVRFDQCNTAMEIGGGFGAWAHLSLSMYPNIRKLVYLDIPPMIYIANQYLKHHFGDAVIDYSKTKDMDDIRFKNDSSLEILCICPWQIENVNTKLDIFWNTASFSEMEPKIVSNYAKHIKRFAKPNTDMCLILNKTQSHPKFKITMPDEVISAFEPEFKFQSVMPAQEHQNYSQYWVGQSTSVSMKETHNNTMKS